MAWATNAIPFGSERVKPGSYVLCRPSRTIFMRSTASTPTIVYCKFWCHWHNYTEAILTYASFWANNTWMLHKKHFWYLHTFELNMVESSQWWRSLWICRGRFRRSPFKWARQRKWLREMCIRSTFLQQKEKVAAISWLRNYKLEHSFLSRCSVVYEQ